MVMIISELIGEEVRMVVVVGSEKNKEVWSWDSSGRSMEVVVCQLVGEERWGGGHVGSGEDNTGDV